jgi:hypothetical protein
VQVAGTMITLVTSVDNSKFWTSVARNVLACYLVLACIFMFQVSFTPK